VLAEARMDEDVLSGAELEALISGKDAADCDEAAIPELVADGRIVFVNVTADWCITCRVNESLVLARSPVREKLSSDGIISMKGDWTLPSEAISDYLARFGRYGIPFDAVYGPGMPQGEALPELLSRDTVLSALDRAAGADK